MTRCLAFEATAEDRPSQWRQLTASPLVPPYSVPERSAHADKVLSPCWYRPTQARQAPGDTSPTIIGFVIRQLLYADLLRAHSPFRVVSAPVTALTMQFAPWASDIELPFFTSLASHKINHDKLDDSARKLLGVYEVRPNDSPETSCRMQVLGNALTSDE